MKVTELAPAKLNLTLEVGEKRADGYHDLQSVMSCAALYDEITLESGVGDGITMDCDCPALACDETNLCVRAVRNQTTPVHCSLTLPTTVIPPTTLSPFLTVISTFLGTTSSVLEPNLIMP